MGKKEKSVETTRRSRAGVGGPKTPEGKARSSRNALKHGLRAERLAFHDEENAEFEELLDRFCEEHDPRTPTEEMLVREIWRHACFLQLTAEAEGAAWRKEMRFALEWRNVTEETAGEQDWDAARASAAGDEQTALITRYRRSHERGFYDALRKLVEFKDLREAMTRSRPAQRVAAPVARLSAEAEQSQSTERTPDGVFPACVVEAQRDQGGTMPARAAAIPGGVARPLATAPERTQPLRSQETEDRNQNGRGSSEGSESRPHAEDEPRRGTATTERLPDGERRTELPMTNGRAVCSEGFSPSPTRSRCEDDEAGAAQSGSTERTQLPRTQESEDRSQNRRESGEQTPPPDGDERPLVSTTRLARRLKAEPVGRGPVKALFRPRPPSAGAPGSET